MPYFKETFSTPVPGASGTSAEFPHDHVADEKMGTLICNHTVSVNEILGWTLAAVSMVLFVVSFTINVIMLWVYRKRQSKDNNVESPMYEMEGNPCYESKLQQSADTTGQQEAHVYERVKLRN